MSRNIYAFTKRTFLNPASTRLASYIEAHVETGHEAPYRYGDNIITIADCQNVIKLEFFLASKAHRRISLRKIDLLIRVLTRFREALVKQIELIEKENSHGKSSKKTRKTSR
jgi:hypothetical protein